ncbi:MAG: hypothetical protein PHT44_03460 [Candidatus Portnoybacteria bacterium]|nr:hypothetical protein [Candidatus Portnoybacteria bacterium]MDD4983115.1 hypothetical protein [Candidatus Portnoybacteria bacterium]
MEKIKKILSAIRKFFCTKESERPGYVSVEEIARIMNSPLTKEQEESFPREFAKTVAELLEGGERPFPREFGEKVAKIIEGKLG